MKNGTLGKEINHKAKAHGINISHKVECDIDDYHTLNCFDKLQPGSATLIITYNPNLSPVKGLFLQV